MWNPRFTIHFYKLWASSASAVIRSWFIYELQKSTTIAFSRNSLYTFYSRNPTCGIPPCLRISNRKYPPCPQNSIIVNPPSPSEILKAVRGMEWIFSGIAQLTLNLPHSQRHMPDVKESSICCPLYLLWLLKYELSIQSELSHYNTASREKCKVQQELYLQR